MISKALLVLTVLALAGCGTTTRTVTQPSPTTPTSTEDLPTHHACGRARWAVKTLTDQAAAKVNLSPIESSIPEMVSFPAPMKEPTTRVPNSPEVHTYRLRVHLIGVRQEGDSDYHLVIVDDSNETTSSMIAEIPDPGCASKSRVAKQIAAVREEFIRRFGVPSTSGFTRLDASVTITGVGFFDHYHRQRGAGKLQPLSANQTIELHPVIGLK